AAYTIFYMGINLGAAISPLLCGWLTDNMSYQAGFIAAGFGMLLGLFTYLFGLPLIHELPQNVSEEPKEQPAGTMRPPLADEEGIPEGAEELRQAADLPAQQPRQALSEQQAAQTPWVARWLTQPVAVLLAVLGVVLALAGPVLWYLELMSGNNAISMGVAAGATLFAAWIATRVQFALRDRVLAIILMGIPVAAFWAAAEQAGNALNIWADKTTDRYLTATAPPPPVFPAQEAAKAEGEGGVLQWV